MIHMLLQCDPVLLQQSLTPENNQNIIKSVRNSGKVLILTDDLYLYCLTINLFSVKIILSSILSILYLTYLDSETKRSRA